MTEEFDKGISKLVPEFALPIILEVENEGLKLLGSFIALLGKEVWDVDVAHSGGICIYVMSVKSSIGDVHSN